MQHGGRKAWNSTLYAVPTMRSVLNAMVRLKARLMAKVAGITREPPWRSEFASLPVAIEGQTQSSKICK